jgi:hemerythrin-like domain-containing protein
MLVNKKLIKRSASLMSLSKEHHFSLLFCWKIRQGLKNKIEASRIIKYVQYFETHFLLPHFKQEEAIVFLSLNDHLVQKAIDQHQQIKKLIGKIQGAKNDAGILLEKLAGLADDHVRYEERELFPHLEDVLSYEQLEWIGKKLKDDHTLEMKDEYTDEFWINNGQVKQKK